MNDLKLILIAIINCYLPTVIADEKPKSEPLISISQLSNYHGEIGKDSIVLYGEKDNEAQYFTKLNIYRKGDKIFEIDNKNIELEGFEGKCFVETRAKQGYFYIFTNNDRPLPNKYLILKVESDTVYLFGITNNSTAEIFGDIDRDGKFEIGGYQDYNEKNIYVFEIADNFRKDDSLTTCLNDLIKKKK